MALIQSIQIKTKLTCSSLATFGVVFQLKLKFYFSNPHNICDVYQDETSILIRE